MNSQKNNYPKEQWPESYLGSWSAFSKDERSIKYMFALLQMHNVKQESAEINVADIMSGDGKVGVKVKKHLVSDGFKVNMTYVDSSAKILESIPLESNDNRITADVTNLSTIPSESFDVITCRYGFNNLSKEQWIPALNECLRTLKPKGVFLLQDHFIPGPVFSELVNEAEQFLAKLENKKNIPFIFSTEEFNKVLDNHPQVQSRVKAGYGLFVNIWERLKAKRELLPNFEKTKTEILNFYKDTCLENYKVLIVDPEEYIHVFNVTYAIVKK